MKTALIVLNYNDSETTLDFTKRIEKYKVIDKIIVVDNCSTDGSYAKLESLRNENVEVIQSEGNKGYAYGNNYGIKALKEQYDYVIISNPDIFIEEKAIKECIKKIEENPKIGAITPTMYLGNGQLKKRSCWKERTFWKELINTSIALRLLFWPIYKSGIHELDFKKEMQEVDCITGSFMIFQEKVLKEVNLFDEHTFLYYEEDIICKKIREKGYKIVNLNSEKYIHSESKSISKSFNLLRKKKILAQSQKYYLKKYKNMKKWQEIILDIVNLERKVELIFQILLKK